MSSAGPRPAHLLAWFALPLCVSACVDTALWDAACERGHAKACWRLGQHARERGTDEAEQMGHFSRACVGGWQPACTDEGLLWTQGDPNSARARTLFEGACEWGDLGGCHNLAHMLRHQVPRDFTRAERLFSRACSGGIQRSCEQLDRIRLRLEVEGLDDAKRAAARRGLARRCEEGASSAVCADLAAAEMAGLGGPAVPKRGLRRMRRACEDYPRACELVKLADGRPAEEQRGFARCYLGDDQTLCAARIMAHPQLGTLAEPSENAGIIGVLESDPASAPQKSSSSSTPARSRSKER